jgi:glycine cleavage system H protein
VKTFEELDIRKDLSYAKTHEWMSKGTGNAMRVGVDDYAQSALGDIVYVELPSVGDAVTAGAPCGSLESTKAVSDLNSPITGTVTAVNASLADSPELINSSPYDDGWIFEAEATGSDSLGDLMDSGAYSKFLETLEHGE